MRNTTSLIISNNLVPPAPPLEKRKKRKKKHSRQYLTSCSFTVAVNTPTLTLISRAEHHFRETRGKIRGKRWETHPNREPWYANDSPDATDSTVLFHVGSNHPVRPTQSRDRWCTRAWGTPTSTRRVGAAIMRSGRFLRFEFSLLLSLLLFA